jgi:hypothetical protein
MVTTIILALLLKEIDMNGTYEDPKKNYRRGGDGNKSEPAQPFKGPENPGPPASMRKALANKTLPTGTGVGLPNKGTSAPGSVR